MTHLQADAHVSAQKSEGSQSRQWTALVHRLHHSSSSYCCPLVPRTAHSTALIGANDGLHASSSLKCTLEPYARYFASWLACAFYHFTQFAGQGRHRVFGPHAPCSRAPAAACPSGPLSAVWQQEPSTQAGPVRVVERNALALM